MRAGPQVRPVTAKPSTIPDSSKGPPPPRGGKAGKPGKPFPLNSLEPPENSRRRPVFPDDQKLSARWGPLPGHRHPGSGNGGLNRVGAEAVDTVGSGDIVGNPLMIVDRESGRHPLNRRISPQRRLIGVRKGRDRQVGPNEEQGHGDRQTADGKPPFPAPPGVRPAGGSAFPAHGSGKIMGVRRAIHVLSIHPFPVGFQAPRRIPAETFRCQSPIENRERLGYTMIVVSVSQAQPSKRM